MLESISAFFDHNAKRILEVSKKFKYVAIISAIVAFYNLFNFFSPEGGATSVLLLVFSSLAFWVSLIIRVVLKLVAKVADRISKAVKTADDICDIPGEVVTEISNRGKGSHVKNNVESIVSKPAADTKIQSITDKETLGFKW